MLDAFLWCILKKEKQLKNARWAPCASALSAGISWRGGAAFAFHHAGMEFKAFNLAARASTARLLFNLRPDISNFLFTSVRQQIHTNALFSIYSHSCPHRVSWVPDWPSTCYVARDDLELLILSFTFCSAGTTGTYHHMTVCCWRGTQAFMLGKHSSNMPTSQHAISPSEMLPIFFFYQTVTRL